jgi:hypothetical protein
MCMMFLFIHIQFIITKICILGGEREGLTRERFQYVVDEMLSRLESDLNVVLEDAFPGKRLVGGKYSLSTRSITMFMKDVTEQCLRLFPGDELLLDYFKVVFAHELGHAYDEKLIELADQLDEADGTERNLLMLEIEENAWRFARSILPDITLSFVEEIESQSLAPYYLAVEKDRIPA